MYPSTKRQVTPRKRAVGIRPRTFNYYCTSELTYLDLILIMEFFIRLVAKSPTRGTHSAPLRGFESSGYSLRLLVLLYRVW